MLPIQRQVSPLRITFLYETNLPGSIPVLELLLASYRVWCRLNVFVVHQHMYAVLLREPFYNAVFVFQDTALEVVRGANVQCAVALTCQYVYVEITMPHTADSSSPTPRNTLDMWTNTRDRANARSSIDRY